MTSVLQTIGNSLQLLGAIITGAGLFYAWNRASGRFDEWRTTLRTRLTELRAFIASRGRDMTHEGSGELVVTVELTGEGEVTRGGTDEQRLRRVEKEVEDLSDRLTKTLASVHAEIDDAIATELERFKSLSNVIAVKDIYWSIAGVAVGAFGIVVQMCS